MLHIDCFFCMPWPIGLPYIVIDSVYCTTGIGYELELVKIEKYIVEI